jgi:hypothetical protein
MAKAAINAIAVFINSVLFLKKKYATEAAKRIIASANILIIILLSIILQS